MYFVVGFVLTVGAVVITRWVALRWGVVDRPDGERKLKQRVVPLLGGVPLFLVFWGIVGYVVFFHPVRGIDLIRSKIYIAAFCSFILVVLGSLDDHYRLSAKSRLLATGVVALLAVLGGITIEKLTNPFGGFFDLTAAGFLGGLLSFAWLMGMMYTVKITDGVDGLATGIVFVGALLIYFLTTVTPYYQPNVGLLSVVFAGVCLGFLVCNIYPAKIYLGEGGGLFLGFMLGVLAIIAGSKLAIALLAMGIPILDLARVVYLRLKAGQPLFRGDRRHLHFALLDRGYSERLVALFYGSISFVFGLAALFLQSIQKVLALGVLVLVMVGIVVFLNVSFGKDS